MFPADGGRNKSTRNEGAALQRPICSGSGARGTWDCKYRHFPGFEGKWSKQFPNQMVSTIKQFVSSVPLYRSPWPPAWFLSLIEILPCSLAEQPAAVKTSFLFPAASLETSYSGGTYLATKIYIPPPYGNALLPFQFCMALWDYRHCSRASSFSECPGEATVSKLYINLTVFWREGWGS